MERYISEGNIIRRWKNISSTKTQLQITKISLQHISQFQFETKKKLDSAIMSVKYAKDQPAGFTNRIERVAIVGVSRAPHLYSAAHIG